MIWTTKKKALKTKWHCKFVKIRDGSIKSGIVEIKIKSDIHCYKGKWKHELFILLQISSRNSLKAQYHKDAKETTLSWLILEISEYH